MQDVDHWNLVPQWRWGVGTEAQLASVWKSYHVGVLVTTKKIAGVTAYYIAHTEAAYVIDANGYQRAMFLWPYSADAVTQRWLRTSVVVARGEPDRNERAQRSRR